MGDADQTFNLEFWPPASGSPRALRLVLEMDGEIIDRADPHVGLLHRGTEKLIENKKPTRRCHILTGLIMSRHESGIARALAVASPEYRGAQAVAAHPRSALRDWPDLNHL